MDWVRSKVSHFGLWLGLAGLLSMILYLFDMNLRILRYIDMNGPVIGWGIRIGLVVAGGLLYLVGPSPEKEDAAAKQAFFADPRVVGLIEQIRRVVPVSARAATGAATDGSSWELAHVIARDASGNIVHPADGSMVQMTAYLRRREERLAFVHDARTQTLQHYTPDAHTWLAAVGT